MLLNTTTKYDNKQSLDAKSRPHSRIATAFFSVSQSDLRSFDRNPKVTQSMMLSKSFGPSISVNTMLS